MLTIKVIHEVRWLPNDVEAKLNHIIELLEGDPAALQQLTAKLKESTDSLQAAVEQQQSQTGG